MGSNGDSDIHHGYSSTKQEENKMSKKKISRIKFEMLVDDLTQKAKSWFRLSFDATAIFRQGFQEVLLKHFEIV